MIESVMLVSVGVLIASLLWLLVLPAVWNRAVRLTTKRMEETIPVSMAEIQADKDHIRAEFAVSTRRLELGVEQLKHKTANQLSEISARADEIIKMRQELDERATTIVDLEDKERNLKQELKTAHNELTAKTTTLTQTEKTLADTRAILGETKEALQNKTKEGEKQTTEILALRNHLEHIEARATGLDKTLIATKEKLGKESATLQSVNTELKIERKKNENQTTQLVQVQEKLAEQTAEAQALSKRIMGLEARLTEQTRELAARTRETQRLTKTVENLTSSEVAAKTAAQNFMQDSEAAQREIESTKKGLQSTMEHLRSEKARLEAELAQVRADRTNLQNDLITLKQETEQGWASERLENAMLRERINDIAAEVAHLTAALEGPGSTIDTILATVAKPAAPAPSATTSKPAATSRRETSSHPVGNLADRIRALQSRTVPAHS